MKGFFTFLRQAFCEKEYPSSKRILAAVIILCVCFCTIIICTKYYFTENVKSLLEVEIIAACALSGISSVTSIWKQGKK